MMSEEWRPITCVTWKNKSNKYEVSTLGRVRKNGKIIAQHLGRYWAVSIGRSHRVHVLVGKTFIPNPDNLQLLHHKDNDKLNNRVDNLEWSTKSLNGVRAHADGCHDHKYMNDRKRALNKIKNGR